MKSISNMRIENIKMCEEFTVKVELYKRAMEYVRNEPRTIKRCVYGLRTFGLAYLQYNLARFRVPILFGNTTATLFFGRKLTLPAADIGSYSFSMYGIIPHKCERKLTEWILRNVSESDIFYDVGVHLGFYTALAEALTTIGEVHSFEANQSLAKYLHRNFAHSKHVSVSATAVAASTGEVDFYDATFTEDSSMSSRFNLSELDIKPIKVPAISLDDYLTLGNKPPTIIKFDIEGGEYDAIIGAEKLIREYKPCILMEVWCGKNGTTYSDRAVKKLQELGYVAFSLEHGGVISPKSVDGPVRALSDLGKSRDNFVFKVL